MTGDGIVEDLRCLGQALGHHRSLEILLDCQLKIPIARSLDDKDKPTVIVGTMAIGHYMVKNISKFKLDVAERAAVLQWIEYRLTRIGFDQNAADKRHLFQELNDHLRTRSYLIGHKCTSADFIVALALHAPLGRLNLLEREVYPHLGRWFSQVERNCIGCEEIVLEQSEIKQRQLPWSPRVVFSKTPLI